MLLPERGDRKLTDIVLLEFLESNHIRIVSIGRAS